MTDVSGIKVFREEEAEPFFFFFFFPFPLRLSDRSTAQLHRLER